LHLLIEATTGQADALERDTEWHVRDGVNQIRVKNWEFRRPASCSWPRQSWLEQPHASLEHAWVASFKTSGSRFARF
jgi:hypothetical protein